LNQELIKTRADLVFKNIRKKEKAVSNRVMENPLLEKFRKEATP